MKKNKLIGASLALALATGVITPQAFAATELEQDLINAYEIQEILDKDTEEVNKIRRNTEEKPSNKDDEKENPSDGKTDPKDDEKPSDKKDDNKDKTPEEKFDPNKGFDKKEDAIKEAEKIIKDSKINKGYDISKGADGKYYIELKPEENKTIDKKEIKDTKETKETKKGKEGNKKAENKETNEEKAVPKKNSNTNVKTGIAPLTGTIATLIASVGALSYNKKERK